MDEESPDDILLHRAIDGEEEISWIKRVRMEVNSAQPTDHSKSLCTIFKVPKHIRHLDPEAYTPMVVSIGPFHHLNSYESSVTMHYKWRCVRRLLSRHRSPKRASQLLDKCLLELKKQDGKVRSCYSGEFYVSLGAHRLALIMLLDGCFIIHLMLKMGAGKSKEERKKEEGMEEEIEGEEVELLNEEIEMGETEEEKLGKLKGKATEEDEWKKRRGCMNEIREEEVVLNIRKEEEQLEGPTVAGLFTLELVVNDLLKLENQIPFFIIRLLFDHLKTSKDRKINLVHLALQLFEDIHPEQSKSFEERSSEEYRHLLHLFYSSRIPSRMPSEPPSAPTSTSAPGRIPRLIELMKSRWKKAEANPSQGTPTSAPTSTSSPRSISGLIFELMKSRWKKAEANPSQGTPTSAPTSTSAPGCIPSIMEHMKSKLKKAEANPSQGTPTSIPKWIPSATELNRAGVKFKRKELADSFLNITFEWSKMKITPLLCLLKLCLMLRSGQMEIPPLQIYGYTSHLFRNLIAFEECYFDTKLYITMYTLFMDCIIDQPEDVLLLHLEGILEHNQSNDQVVAKLFSQLSNHIHFVWEKNYLTGEIIDVALKVDEFYKFKWHKWLAGLRRDYLGSPWAIISVLAAIILLLLTIDQATFTTLSYFHSS